MGLWIRSQSKIDLMCVKRVQYGHANNRHIIYGKDLSMFLGEYDTKERCLEILDEIQGLLRGDLHIFLTACDVPNEVYRDLVTRKNKTILCEPSIEYFQSNVMVYQMPEE